MAQDFERSIQRNVGTSAVTVRTANSDEYMEAAGQTVPKPNTWIWAQKDIRDEVIKLRKILIDKFVDEHIESWNNYNLFKRLDRK